jgi:hypothetical protein
LVLAPLWGLIAVNVMTIIIPSPPMVIDPKTTFCADLDMFAASSPFLTDVAMAFVGRPLFLDVPRSEDTINYYARVPWDVFPCQVGGDIDTRISPPMFRKYLRSWILGSDSLESVV